MAVTAMNVDGAGMTVEREGILTCTLSPFALFDVSYPPPPQMPRLKHPFLTTSPPLLRHHRPQYASLSSHLSRKLAALTQRSQAPCTDPRTGLRYHDKSVCDLIKNLARSLLPPLSSCTQHLTITSFFFAESQRLRTASPPEGSIPILK